MQFDRYATACFTGHRSLPRESEADIRAVTERAVRDLILCGYDTFLTGGALGFDTLAQLTAVRLRREFPYLRVVMVIPCQNQDAPWSERDRSLYRTLLRLSDERIVLHEQYTVSCMHERNRYMIDHSSVCIACHDGRVRGGTASTVRYAAQSGIRVVNVWRGGGTR